MKFRPIYRAFMTGVRRLSSKSRTIGQKVVKITRSRSRLQTELPPPLSASLKTSRIPKASTKEESQQILQKRFEGTEPLPHCAMA